MIEAAAIGRALEELDRLKAKVGPDVNLSTIDPTRRRNFWGILCDCFSSNLKVFR
jgi:hypothetical protein